MRANQILEDEVSNICEHYFDSSIYLHDGFSYLHLILPTRSDSSQQVCLLLSCFFVCHSLGSVRVFVLVWVGSYLLEQGQFICDFTNGKNATPSPNNCKLLTFLHKGVETYMPLPHPCRNGDRPSLEQIPHTHSEHKYCPEIPLCSACSYALALTLIFFFCVCFLVQSATFS